MSAVLLASLGWGRYRPYAHMYGPYRGKHAALYEAFSPGQRMVLFKRLLMASTDFSGDSKGCGLDIAELESSSEVRRSHGLAHTATINERAHLNKATRTGP